MIELCLDTEQLGRLLVIGCHADDIEIGCGGTVLSLVGAHPELEVTWIVLAASGQRAGEARASADAFLVDAGRATVEVHAHRDGYLPSQHAEVKDRFEALKELVDPDLVLTHRADDAHQDHRLASELTWNTFRNHAILEYEVPKWDGDTGRPNIYAPLDETVARRKVELLLLHYPTQAEKHWFDSELFMGLMRMRGIECGSRYAEGFAAKKLVMRAGER